MTRAIPVLAYHSVAPGEKMTPERFGTHLGALARSGLPTLGARDLDRAARGFLLTFDDGFADLWTHAAPLLAEAGFCAVVFAIPARAGEGPPRAQGQRAWPGSAAAAHAEAALAPGAHPAFLRWSELEALEGTGLVVVQSHGLTHRQGWVGDEIVGFHRVGRRRWFVPDLTGGDDRAGLPVYRRGSALAHRLYRDDPSLREALVSWLEARGAEDYVGRAGPEAVTRELRAVADAHRRAHPWDGWETREERRARTLDEIAGARAALEARLGGVRDELCLPWGQYDEATLECARRVGIRRVYTLNRGPNPVGGVGFLVNRFEPRARGPVWLRLRLWIYRSAGRAGLYARLAGGN